MGGRMTFPNGEHDLRNDVTFRSRSQSIHHRGTSSFENLPMDMIKRFPFEPMHMIYLGVTKKLVSLWKELAIKRLNGMDQSIIASINDALDSCRQHTTYDFKRKCRSLNEVSVWKATECRLFLLYLGPVVLHNRLPLSMYRNFQSLSLSIYLLSHPKFHSTYTLHGTRRKFGISKYKFYSTVQSALCSHFRSATCSEKEITNAMATASQAFLHDARDKVHKHGWRSKERLASQALSDVTNIINDSSTST
ncbi:unnamed protein product [Schistosoma curassoni]|nr:unnamed protein product [Schistosoma curassoni]